MELSETSAQYLVSKGPSCPPGYKQTEVGVIPEDWDVMPCEEVVTIIDGDRGFNYPSKSDLKHDGFCLFLNAGNVTKTGFKFKSCEFISKIKDENLRKGKLKRYDVVLTTRGTVGNFAYYDDSVPYENIRINSGMVLLRRRYGDIDNRYLYIVFTSHILHAQIERLSFGSAQPQLTVRGISNFRIPIPPTKTEQTAIANALSDVVGLIQSLTRLIAKKRQIKQGAMQTLLNPYENDRLKEGWVEKKLGEVATLKARIGWQGLTTAEYRKTGDYFLITGTEFKNGFIDWESCFYVDYSRYKQDRNIQVKENDVLVTKDGTIGKIAFIKHVPKPATLNSGVFVIRPIGDSFHPEFFYYALLSDVFTKFLSQLSAGSTINHLYQKDFVHFQFYTPEELNEQARFANILSDMDAEIASLETKLAKYQQIKQGMMQNLLTGRIRLVKTDTKAEAVA